MRFKQPRQKISSKLSALAYMKIRKDRIRISKASRKNLIELVEIGKEIEQIGLPKYLVRKKLQGSLGYGIFLRADTKPILRGEAIGAYSGKVIIVPKHQVDDSDYIFSLLSDLKLTKEEQKWVNPKMRFHPRRLYSIDLDAEKMGNFTRYINHSSEEPNIEARLIEIPQNDIGLEPGRFEMIYFARKKISPGEQLLICYEGDDESYWGAMNIEPFPMTPRTFQIDSKGNFKKIV